MSVTIDCSLAAYKWMNESGNASVNRKRVYDLFYAYGEMTGAIASEKYRSSFPSAGSSEVVRNRISELMRMDVLEVKGTVIDPNTKMTVSLFGIVRDRMPKKFVPKKSKAQTKIDALLTEIEMLNDHISKESIREQKMLREISRLNTVLNNKISTV